VTDATVENQRTGFLVPAGAAAAFADVIAELDADRPRWMRMAGAAHAAVATGFRLDKTGDAYHRLLLAGLEGRYPLIGTRRWRRPLDLESLVGDGVILEGIRRAARWWRRRSRS
jgi:hypothetical protein